MAKARNILRDVFSNLWEIINLAAPSQTVTIKQSNEVFISAVVDAAYVLPKASAAIKGMKYTFVAGIVSTTTGLKITPATGDAIYGGGLTAVANEALVNTAATDAKGDQATVVCDGTAWLIMGLIGTWAKV